MLNRLSLLSAQSFAFRCPKGGDISKALLRQLPKLRLRGLRTASLFLLLASGAVWAETPAAPSNVEITSVSAYEVVLHWADNSSDETGFNIWRQSGSGTSYDGNFTVQANVTTYSDSGVTPGMGYYYYVQAFIDEECSDWAGGVWVNVPYPIPSPPTLSVSAQGPWQAGVSWWENDTTYVTGYDLERTSSFPGAGGTQMDYLNSFSGYYSDQSVMPGVPYAYRVRAEIQGGNQTEWSGYATVVMPLPAPILSVSCTTDTQVVLSWSEDYYPATTGFEVYRWDSGTIAAPGADDRSYADTPPSRSTWYFYQVRAVADSGPSDWSNQVGIYFFGDWTAPTITVSSGPQGGFTTDPRPTISVQINDGALGVGVNWSSLFFAVDSNEITPQMESDDQGYNGFSWTPAYGLFGGWHFIEVSVSDNLGNENSQSWSFTVDTTPPTFTDLTPPDGGFSRPCPTISAQVAGDLSVINWNTLAVLLDGDPVSRTVTRTNEVDSGFSYPVGAPLADGPHTVCASVQGEFWESVSRTWSFTVDSSPPVILSVYRYPYYGCVNVPSSGHVYADIFDSESGINWSTLSYSLNGGEPITYPGASGNWTYYLPANSAEGQYTVVIYVEDNAGNSANTETTFWVDSTPPDVSNQTPAPYSWTTNRRPTISASVSDSGCGLYFANLYVDGNSVAWGPELSYTPDYESDLAEGLHTAEVWAGDWADNEVHETWTFLVAQPAATAATGPLAIMTTFWPRPNAAGWNNSDVTVYFKADDSASTITGISVDTGSGPPTITDQVVVYADGANQVISGTATDGAGRTATTGVNLNIDQTPPEFDPIGDVFVEATGAFGAHATDVTLPTVTATDNLTGPPTIQAGSLPSTLPFGTTVVDVSATDGAGNTGYGGINVIVRDTTPPTISISPRTVTVTANNPYGTPVDFLTLTTITASDDVTPSPTLFYSHESSGFFAAGTTWVHVWAIDEAGNVGSDDFSVTVIAPDLPPPPVPTPTTALDGNDGPIDCFTVWTVGPAFPGSPTFPAGCEQACSASKTTLVIPDYGPGSNRGVIGIAWGPFDYTKNPVVGWSVSDASPSGGYIDVYAGPVYTTLTPGIEQHTVNVDGHIITLLWRPCNLQICGPRTVNILSDINVDTNGNGVPDAADGTDVFPANPPSQFACFTPITIQYQTPDPAATLISVWGSGYSSDPRLMQREILPGSTDYVYRNFTYYPYPDYPSSSFRIWTKDGNALRRCQDINAGGDWVAPGGPTYRLADLPTTLYLEGIFPGDDLGLTITMEWHRDPSTQGNYIGNVVLTDTIQVNVNRICIDLSDGYDYDSLVKIHGMEVPRQGHEYSDWFAAAPMLDENHPVHMMMKFDGKTTTKLQGGTWQIKDQGSLCHDLTTSLIQDPDFWALVEDMWPLDAEEVYELVLDTLGVSSLEAPRRWQTRQFTQPGTRTLTLHTDDKVISFDVTVGKFEWVDMIGNQADVAQEATDRDLDDPTDQGPTYRIRVTPIPTPPCLLNKPVSIRVLGSGAAGYNKGYGYTIGRDNLVQYAKRDALFSFVAPTNGPPPTHKGVTPGNRTVICAGGNSVIAQLENPKGGDPLAVAQIETMIPFADPYSKDHHTNPAIYCGLTIDGGNLRVIAMEGPEFAGVGGNYWGGFEKVMTAEGNQMNHQDKDSAQVAVTWDVGGTCTNAKAYTQDDELYAGAIWEWLDDNHKRTPHEAVKHEFPIPELATKVTVVLVYTDVVNNPEPLDAPAVFGAWFGTKLLDGGWTFEGIPKPLNPSYKNEHYREPNGTECPGLTEVVRKYLSEVALKYLSKTTTFTLKDRKDLIHEDNTGFDLVPP